MLKHLSGVLKKRAEIVTAEFRIRLRQVRSKRWDGYGPIRPIFCSVVRALRGSKSLALL